MSPAKRKKVTLKEIQSLIGSLNVACRAVTPGRAFFRRHIDEANHRIRLTLKARKDISAWFEFLQDFNGQLTFFATNWTSSDVLSLTTDASGFAFGAVMGDSWFQGHFPSGTPNTFPLKSSYQSYWLSGDGDQC